MISNINQQFEEQLFLKKAWLKILPGLYLGDHLLLLFNFLSYWQQFLQIFLLIFQFDVELLRLLFRNSYAFLDMVSHSLHLNLIVFLHMRFYRSLRRLNLIVQLLRHTAYLNFKFLCQI
ncbi:hypothetical protein FGO68_gene1587 [Halteria grandinella]|uniref:Transmembrane protein n=1 Tax=Halteria grandinella TaxID=5974 RepID=A0A8J8NW04_HALGN|nr:hypothetical protein FGO68_gene1587 [Halteria grandinella]